MIPAFHPEAATEYAEHVAFYKSLRKELGIRFHEAVKLVIANVCAMPDHYSTEFPPDIPPSGTGFTTPSLTFW